MATPTPMPSTLSRRGAARRIIASAGCALVLVTAAACSSDGDEDTSETTLADPVATTAAPEPASSDPLTTDASTATTAPETTSAPASGDVELPLDATGAADTALGVTPGVVIDIGRDTEGGQAIWEVVVVADADGTGVEHYVAAENADVLRQQPYDVPNVANGDRTIDIQTAMATALDTVPDTSVFEADLGTEAGRTIWGILLGSNGVEQVEVYVDVQTGAVVKQETVD